MNDVVQFQAQEFISPDHEALAQMTIPVQISHGMTGLPVRVLMK